MALLKQSTTYTRDFLMVDSTDHVTGKTGLTVTVTLSKAGGSFAAAGGTITEISSGWYKIALTTTDTNTLGELAFHCTGSGADPTDFVDQVSANLPDDIMTLLNTVAGYVDTEVAAIKAKTDQLTFTVANQIDANVLDWKSATAPAMTGDAFARLGAPVGASISADIAGEPAALLDAAAGVETGVTVRQALRVFLAALAGKANGAATTTMHFRDQADGKNRITATVDADGNRTAITLDAS